MLIPGNELDPVCDGSSMNMFLLCTALVFPPGIYSTLDASLICTSF